MILGQTKQIASKTMGYATLAAILAVLFFFLVLPVGLITSKAFIVDSKFSLEYFSLLFSNDLQVDAIGNSIMIGIATTVLATIVALPLALISTRYIFPLKGLLSGLVLVPMVMPPFVGAIGVQRFFSRRGSVNQLLMEWGWTDMPIDWLGGQNMFWAVVVLEVLHLYPIMYLNLSAALANIDPSMEEIAVTLGASRWKRYLNIIWPLSRPGYFAGAIIVFIWALTDLGTPLLVGYHDTIPVRIFNMVTDVNENPVGYAMVFVVILITVTFFLLSRMTLNEKKYQMLARGHVTNPQQRASALGTLGIWFVLGAVTLFALIPHISVLITSLSDNWFMTILPENYTLEHYRMALTGSLSAIGIENSLFFSSLSVTVDIILGLLVAYVVVRKLIPFSGALDSLCMIPLALPGIVLAFGYVITYSNTILDPLANPTVLLVVAYSIRRLPFMVRSASAGLQQTSVSLEEASATFGASRFHTLRRITIPLVTANLIAGALLCFAYAMLDVSDSLILAMKDRFYPLTKAIYSLFLEHGSGEFVASALGIIAMCILTLCILIASLILGKRMGELFRS
ncbi:MAG: ABC transporter permease [Oligoflexales bacterium]